jgi:hypothetical protein
MRLGVPYGCKDGLTQTPTVPYSEPDFWRGVVDSDGSLGLDGQGLPFVSLVTNSDSLAESYKDYIQEVTGYRPRTKRNRRDDAYNISVNRERGQALISALYYRDCVCLRRKQAAADKALSWQRPNRHD